MPALGLGNAICIGDGGGILPANVISITSGGGYAESVYTSTRAGQWYADDVAIDGETGSSYTMTVANEGKAVRCGNSNVIEMWVLSDLASTSAFDARQGVTLASGKVSSWEALSGGVTASQGTGARQPAFDANAFGTGYPGVSPGTASDEFLEMSSGTYGLLFLNAASVRLDWSVGITLSTPNNSITFNADTLISGISSAANAKININGVSSVTSTSASITTVQSFAALFAGSSGGAGLGRFFDGTRLFNNSGNSRVFVGRFGVLALSSARWSDADQQRVEGCVAWQYNKVSLLPSDHPYKSAAPRIS